MEEHIVDEEAPKENKPPRLSLGVGLMDKLSLNSPRTPLAVSNSSKNILHVDTRGTTGTPPGQQKRKFLSAGGCENASPSTPKSSLDKGASVVVGRNVLVRGRKIGGFRGSSDSAIVSGNLHQIFPVVLKTVPGSTNENVLPRSTSNQFSTAMSDLFNKPILSLNEAHLATLIEEEGDDFGKSKRFPGILDCKVVATGESFKRPSPPEELYGSQNKRAKSFHYGNASYLSDDEDDQSEKGDSFSLKVQSPTLSPTSKFNRSQSESSLCIKSAVERIDSDPTLVGDGSRSFSLPVIDGKHNDLREISAETLVGLMEGKYKEVVESYEVIDCRYPYEYHGGHIKSAINLHTQLQVYERFMKQKNPKIGSYHRQREILIFHCEFSSQRGPDLCRYLRQSDRTVNETSFPSLHYPELYVLFGGYKMFFEQFKEYCEPQVYLPMVAEKHLEDCRLYKSMSKTDVVQLKKKPNSKLQKKSVRQSSMKKLNLDSP